MKCPKCDSADVMPFGFGARMWCKDCWKVFKAPAENAVAMPAETQPDPAGPPPATGSATSLPAMRPGMMNCPICARPVSKRAEKCPECGHPMNDELKRLKEGRKRDAAALLVFIIFILFIILFSSRH